MKSRAIGLTRGYWLAQEAAPVSMTSPSMAAASAAHWYNTVTSPVAASLPSTRSFNWPTYVRFISGCMSGHHRCTDRPASKTPSTWRLLRQLRDVRPEMDAITTIHSVTSSTECTAVVRWTGMTQTVQTMAATIVDSSTPKWRPTDMEPVDDSRRTTHGNQWLLSNQCWLKWLESVPSRSREVRRRWYIQLPAAVHLLISSNIFNSISSSSSSRTARNGINDNVRHRRFRRRRKRKWVSVAQWHWTILRAVKSEVVLSCPMWHQSTRSRGMFSIKYSLYSRRK